MNIVVEQQYLCRDCLTTFSGAPNLHPGDQFCEHCQETWAAVMAVAYSRQIALEEMGFSPSEVQADMDEWRTRRTS